MQCMVENLLSLTKLEAGQTEIHLESISLEDLLGETWLQLEKMAARR